MFLHISLNVTTCPTDHCCRAVAIIGSSVSYSHWRRPRADNVGAERRPSMLLACSRAGLCATASLLQRSNHFKHGDIWISWTFLSGTRFLISTFYAYRFSLASALYALYCAALLFYAFLCQQKQLLASLKDSRQLLQNWKSENDCFCCIRYRLVTVAASSHS